MVPLRLNRRRFLGCSAAAGIALSQGKIAEAAPPDRVRLGFIGLGNRGTTLLRAALELPGVEVAAVADPEEKHRLRARGIAEKASGRRPEALDSAAKLLERDDIDAVVVAVPCDLHADLYLLAIRSGKSLYAEKPLAPTVAECDAVIAESARNPAVVVHVGHQRRSNPRYREGVDLIRSGALGDLIEARASWTSSNGPISGHGGWLGRRARSGDWMVEQAVHVWDVLHWVADGPPVSASGAGRRDVFADLDPGRDVTDWYHVELGWPSGFLAAMTHSWIDPADDAFTGVSQKILGTAGGLDLGRGTLTYRDKSRPRKVLHPGNLADTRDAVAAFLASVRLEAPPSPPISLREAREAVVTGLMVRLAVDEGRDVSRDEVISLG